jgi:hypothetical protein
MKALPFSALIGVLVLVANPVGAAQFTQQGSKLVGTGAVGNAYQGASVAISADGNTAIVAGLWDNHNAGAVWVYTRSGGVWSQQGNKLVGTGAVGAAYQGASVAISADGNTALVGGPSDNNNAGAAWVWTRSGGVWSQQGSKLVGSGASVWAAYQGRSVAISADGNTAMVGGPGDNYDGGAVWVYTRSGGYGRSRAASSSAAARSGPLLCRVSRWRSRRMATPPSSAEPTTTPARAQCGFSRAAGRCGRNRAAS